MGTVSCRYRPVVMSTNCLKNYHEMNPKGFDPGRRKQRRRDPAESNVILGIPGGRLSGDVFFVRPSPEDRAKMRLWTKRIDEWRACRQPNHRRLHREQVHLPGARSGEDREVPRPHAGPSASRQRPSEYLDGPRVAASAGRAANLPQALRGHEFALVDHDWLSGESYSLADIALVVYLRRMESLHDGGLSGPI